MSQSVSEREEGLAQAHTPGPWMAAAGPSSVVGWPVVAQQGQSICSLSWVGVKPDHVTEDRFAAYRAEVAANGRLIAKAPDLFERLQAIIDWADFALLNPGEFNDHGVRNLAGPVFDEARAVLAEVAGADQ